MALSKGQTIRAEVTAQDDQGRTNGAYRTFETADARKKLWLADARQKGRMDLWEKFEARQRADRE